MVWRKYKMAKYALYVSLKAKPGKEKDVEAFLIKKALARNNGNARKAAEALGLSRSAFYRRLQQYGL